MPDRASRSMVTAGPSSYAKTEKQTRDGERQMKSSRKWCESKSGKHKRQKSPDLPLPEQTGDSCTGSLNMPEYLWVNQCQKNPNVSSLFGKKKKVCNKKCSMDATWRMETSILNIVKPQSVAANSIQWKIHAATNRASQTGEAKNMACVVSRANQQWLTGTKTEAAPRFKHAISNKWKAWREYWDKMGLKTLLTTHLASTTP